MSAFPLQPALEVINPSIQLVDVETHEPYTRLLKPGETALVIYEFQITPNLPYVEKPAIRLTSDAVASLASARVMSVSDNVLWGDNFQDCIGFSKG